MLFNLYRTWGADVIGMTNLTEAKLAREAEICYATMALVTDYDCWHPEHDDVDIVGPEGDFLGGVLLPGVEISLEALTERGAKLPKIDLAPPRGVIGKSTVDAMRSGVIFGFAGAIDGILRRVFDELGDETDVIATGGLASAIVPYTELIDETDDLLTLTGLRLLWERNQND